jgi:hypothetical protein
MVPSLEFAVDRQATIQAAGISPNPLWPKSTNSLRGMHCSKSEPAGCNIHTFSKKPVMGWETTDNAMAQ